MACIFAANANLRRLAWSASSVELPEARMHIMWYALECNGPDSVKLLLSLGYVLPTIGNDAAFARGIRNQEILDLLEGR